MAGFYPSGPRRNNASGLSASACPMRRSRSVTGATRRAAHARQMARSPPAKAARSGPRAGAPVPRRHQVLGPPGHDRHRAVVRRRARRRSVAHRLGRHARQVAGEHDDHVVRGRLEGGDEASRAVPRPASRRARTRRPSASSARASPPTAKTSSAPAAAQRIGRDARQGPAVHLDERLVPPHARAAPAGEHGAGEGGQIGYRSSSPRAMTMRWISLVPSPMIISGASRK